MIRKLLGDGTTAALWLMPIDLPAMVSVAERAPPAFARMVKVNVPPPVCVPDAMLIHDGMPAAAQVHVDVVPIVKLLVVPPGGAVTLAGVTVKVQVPDCVIANVRPAIVMLPVR